MTVSPPPRPLPASAARAGAVEASAARAGAAGPLAVRALQDALAAEEAASYGYGVVGAHLTGAALAEATADWIAHQRARDALQLSLQARGVQPVPAAVAYQLPHQVQTPAQASSLAVILEDRVASAYLSLVALTDQPLRQLGARGVRAAALRGAAWRGRTVAFPGLPASSLARRH